MGLDALFQGLENATFKAVQTLMGQDCNWIEGGITDLVLLNLPTGNRKIQVIGGRVERHTGYNNADIVFGYIEYQKSKFEGLWDLVYNQGINQHITVKGVKYVCTKSQSFFDGQTYRVSINVAIDEPVIPQ